MKYFLLIISLNAFSMTYKSTDNQSMSKFERINVNEERVIEMGQKDSGTRATDFKSKKSIFRT